MESGEDLYESGDCLKALEMFERAITSLEDDKVPGSDRRWGETAGAIFSAVQASIGTDAAVNASCRLVEACARKKRTRELQDLIYLACHDIIRSLSRGAGDERTLELLNAAIQSVNPRFEGNLTLLRHCRGMLYANLSRMDDALEDLKGADQPQTGSVAVFSPYFIHCLGCVKRRLDSLEDALALQHEVLRRSSSEDVDDPELAGRALAEIAAIHYDKGEIDDAISSLGAVLKGIEENQAYSIDLQLLAMDNLARIYHERGDVARSRDILQRAIALAEATDPEELPPGELEDLRERLAKINAFGADG
jgi:tetratricopeptide (TPR) repeat protein